MMSRRVRARSYVATSLALLVAIAGCRRTPSNKPQPSRSSGATSSSAHPAPISKEGSTTPDTLSQASPSYTLPEPASAGQGKPAQGERQVAGAALRERHIARLKSDRSAVTVLTGNDASALAERLCESVVPRRKSDTPVLIKPNICGFDGFKNPSKTGDDGVTGRVTSPEFVRGVVRCLKKRGHTSITIAEGCGNSNAYWQRAIAVSGFANMAQAEGVPLVALDDDGVYDVEGDQPGKPLGITGIESTHVPTLLMPKLLARILESGLFISVPKLKTHRYSVVSIGIKGMQGTVQRSDASPAYNQKWRMHAELKDYLRGLRRGHDDRQKYVASLEVFTERMLDVLELSLPDAILVDGAPAMAGDGFQNIRRLPGMVALGGTNPVLVDRIGAEYLGLWDNAALAVELGGHRSSPLIEAAGRRYGIDLSQPELEGDGVHTLREARPLFFKALAPFTLESRVDPKSPATGSVRAADTRGVSSALPPGAAKTEAGAMPHESEEKPEARAHHTLTAPVLDGLLDAPWQAARPVTWNTDYAGDPTATQTRARFLWNDDALFALFELSGANFNVDTTFSNTRERDKLYQEDCIELFLGIDPGNPRHYYEIELGPLGHWFDLEIDRTRGLQRTEWSSGVELATHRNVEQKTAVIEARFNATELRAALQAGKRLALGLYRMEGKAPRQYLAWSPPRTKKPNFHVPEAFGWLLLEEREKTSD